MQKSTVEVSSRPYGRGSSLSALWLLSAELTTKKKWRNFHQQDNCELRTLLALSSLGSHRQWITTCCTWGKTPERVCVVKTGVLRPDRTAIAAEWHRVTQSSAVMYKKKKSASSLIDQSPPKKWSFGGTQTTQTPHRLLPSASLQGGTAQGENCWNILNWLQNYYSLPKCWNISADTFAPT